MVLGIDLPECDQKKAQQQQQQLGQVDKLAQSSMFTRFREWLRRPRPLQFQIEFALNCMCAFTPLVDNYRRNFGAGPQGKPSAPVWGPDFSRSYKVLPRIKLLYNLWQFYAVLRGLFPRLLQWLIESVFAPERPARCYLLGGFVLERTIDAATSLVYCAIFLCWSLLQRASLRDYTWSVVYFLLTDERQVLQFERLVHRLERSQTARDESGGGAGGRGLDFVLSQGLRREIEQQKLLGAIMLNAVDKIHASRPTIKLRPNRSAAAREHLVELLARYNAILFMLISTIATSITTLVVFQVFPDRHYIQSYPMCEPRIEQLYANKPAEFWSVTVTPLRLAEGVLIGLENLIIWTEIGFVSSFGCVQIALINHDLMIYWRSLHRRIVWLAHRAYYRSNFAPRSQRIAWLTQNDTDDKRLQPLDEPGELVASSQCCRQYLLTLRRLSLELKPSESKVLDLGELHDYASYDEQISQLQNDINDFFLQFRNSDKPVENILILYFGLWSIVFPVQSYYLKTIHGENHSLAVYLFQVALFIIVLGICLQLWVLSRLCMSTYTTLCSLIAHDCSSHTQRFVPIIDYFGEERFYYQMFKRVAFKPTVFMSIIGWSVSANLILESIGRR